MQIMKKVIFNGGILVKNKIVGVQRFLIELLNELDKIVEYGEIELAVPSCIDLNFDYKNIIITKHENIKNTKISLSIWNQFGFRKYVKLQDSVSVDLTLGLSFAGSDIVAIHDCIRELYPENADTFLKKLGRKKYIFLVKKNLKKAKKIITVSDKAKEDICKMYKCNKEDIIIIPNSWQHFKRIESDDNILKKYNLQENNYFFSLGSRFRHKNFKWVAEAAKQNPKYTFVVTGSDLYKNDNELENMSVKNLIFTGYLKDEQIKSLMKYCKAFIQPSLYEGFGIPPMEAMSIGARCIVSKVRPLSDIYQDSVWYIDPLQYENIDMDYIMSKNIADNQLVLDHFSWLNSAKMLKDVLEQITE